MALPSLFVRRLCRPLSSGYPAGKSAPSHIPSKRQAKPETGSARWLDRQTEGQHLPGSLVARPKPERKAASGSTVGSTSA